MRLMMKLTPLGLLLLAPACSKPAIPSLPPAIDVEAVVETKPKPSVEAVTDAKAKARDDAAIEAWGDRLQAAGVRVCEWLNAIGGDYDCKPDTKEN